MILHIMIQQIAYCNKHVHSLYHINECKIRQYQYQSSLLQLKESKRHTKLEPAKNGTSILEFYYGVDKFAVQLLTLMIGQFQR